MQGATTANLENGTNCGRLIFSKVERDVAFLEKLMDFRKSLIFFSTTGLYQVEMVERSY